MAKGGATPSGASLDVYDIAGKTDQDRGEGCAAFTASDLPDGGGGGSPRVVPGDPGENREPENAAGGIRIREKMK